MGDAFGPRSTRRFAPHRATLSGVSALRVTIAIASARFARKRRRLCKSTGQSQRLFRNEAATSRRVREGAIEGSTAMTRTAFCRKSPQAPSVYLLGSRTLGTSDRRDCEEGSGTAARNRPAPGVAAADQVACAMKKPQTAPPQQRGRRVMEFFCGLDVGMDETAICVVDDKGQVALEVAVVTDPDAIKAALTPYLGRLRRLGHEAGSLSPWLHPELLKLGLPAVCLETLHVRAALKAQRNKTDKADALGIAHIMRTGWFRRAHIKSEACYRLRLLLTHRRNLKRKFLDLENAIRHSLKVFGIRLNRVGRGGFAQVVREAVAHDALVSELIDAMLNARAALWKEYCRLHDLVVRLVAGHELCRRFMQIPGVGPIAALSFMTAVDDPSRFKRSRDVAAYFGLTSRRWQSGSSIDVKGRISKAGDGDVRRALYEAASALLTRYKKKDKVKTWGLALAKRASHRKATVAVARKLAVIMHAMWTTGTFYCGDPDTSAAQTRAETAAKQRKLLGVYA
ncbi:transposase [Bradyrhizobium sp. USDA 3397]